MCIKDTIKGRVDKGDMGAGRETDMRMCAAKIQRRSELHWTRMLERKNEQRKLVIDL